MEQKSGHCRGIKTSCKLNDVQDYHILNNWSLDIMRMVLERIISFELGCVINGLYGLMSVQKLNQLVLLFWGKIMTDKSCKPTELSKIELPGPGISPSMTAMQLWALLRYLPLNVGECVAEDNCHWKFLLHLSHLVDVIFATKFTVSMITYMKDLIADHLALFVDLYCKDGDIKL